MSLVQGVLSKRAKHKEELEAEFDLLDETVGDGVEDVEEVEVVKPKKPAKAKKKSSSPKVDGVKERGEWELITRLNESFCTLMETPQLARRLADDVFTDMVDSCVEFFRDLRSKQIGGLDE